MLNNKKQKTYIRSLLDNSDIEEIKLFIAGYANKDVKFKLFLKIHFLNTLKQEKIEPFLEPILYQLIKPKSNSLDKISRVNYNLFLRVLKELEAQSDDKLALEKYVDCFHLCRVILNKIIYTIGIYEQYEDRLKSNSDHFHKTLSDLLKKDIAPELRQDILDYLISLFSKSYYPLHINFSILDTILNTNLEDPAYYNSIHTEITSKLDIEDLDQNSPELLSYYLRILYLENKLIDTKIIELFNYEIITASFQNLFQFKHYKTILYHVSFFRKKNNIKSMFFNDLIINTYEVSNDLQNLKNELGVAFWKSMDFKYFDKLKSLHTIPQWKKHQQSIKTKLVKSKEIANYAQFLKKENLLDDLAKLLRQELNYELIKDFSFYLFEKDKHKLELVYQYYLAHIYKTQPTTSRRPISMLLKFIEDNNDKRMFKNITNFVVKNTNYQIS